MTIKEYQDKFIELVQQFEKEYDVKISYIDIWHRSSSADPDEFQVRINIDKQV